MVDILQVLSSPLGQRILGIYFTSTSLSLLLTHYSEKYLYNKYIMPYLRGSIKKVPTYAKPNVQAQLNRLSRQVARNKPSRCYFRATYEGVAAAGVGFSDHVITDDLIASSSFAANVGGDEFNQLYLKLNGLVDFQTSAFRIVVYRPIKTDTTYAGPITKLDMPRILDPAAFHVYADFWVNSTEASSDRGYSRFINLRNLLTIYNRSSSNLEKGDIHIQFMWEKTTTAATHQTSVQLCYADK